MEYVVYAFSALGIVVMAVDVVLAFRLKAALDRGDLGRGEVGRKWGLLTWMLLFFFLGYLAPLLLLVSQLDPRYVNLLVFLVFIGVLFGSLAMIVTSVAPSFDFFSYYTELVNGDARFQASLQSWSGRS